MKKAIYVCFEGGEGVGKSTQTQKLVDLLRDRGYKVLQTKEPGTPHSPLTMQLRAIMLDNQYDKEMTRQARELISQAIRSIHVERVVRPALDKYDFIIQDRGMLSGLAYGTACGNLRSEIWSLIDYIMPDGEEVDYDKVVLLTGNVDKGLSRALASKKEFASGDAMESRGSDFLNNASQGLKDMSNMFNTVEVCVDGMDVEEVFAEILKALNIEEHRV